MPRESGTVGWAKARSAVPTRIIIAGDDESSMEDCVPTALDDVRRELARANRILAHEDVLDAFGHVSVRHPDDPGRYLLSRSRGPELVEAGDRKSTRLNSSH